MLDIKLFRDNLRLIKDSEKKRGNDLKNVEAVVKNDELWRNAIKRVEDLKRKRNVVSEKINALKKSGKSISKEVKDMKKVVADIKELDDKAAKYLEKRDSVRVLVGNILHESVPKGKDDSENVPVKFVGKKPTFNFKIKDHIELGENLDLFDTDSASKVAGPRFYYGKNELVLLELALLRYAIDYMRKKGFDLISTPSMLRPNFLWGGGFLPQHADDVYYIKEEELCLLGTSEYALIAQHSDDTLKAKNLPKRYAGFSFCYRPEAGTHGRDSKGIFRLHQFSKIEQIILCKPEESWKYFEMLQEYTEEIIKNLGLHFRVVNICTGDLSHKNAKQYDIEVWLPGQNNKKGAYREITSCSNCTNYQSVRLNIRYWKDEYKVKDYVHIVNNTAIATPRTVIAILENFQQRDGSVKVPKVLWNYTGFKVIKPKK